jgi:hypothetical protein
VTTPNTPTDAAVQADQNPGTDGIKVPLPVRAAP